MPIPALLVIGTDRDCVVAEQEGMSVVQGLSHMTFVVRDLDRMQTLLETVLGARTVYDSGADTFSIARERFLLLGEGASPTWIAIMEGDPPRPAPMTTSPSRSRTRTTTPA